MLQYKNSLQKIKLVFFRKPTPLKLQNQLIIEAHVEHQNHTIKIATRNIEMRANEEKNQKSFDTMLGDMIGTPRIKRPINNEAFVPKSQLRQITAP